MKSIGRAAVLASYLDVTNHAYLHVVDGLAFGFHQLGQPMTLPEFRAVFNGPLMGCCGYTQETAETAIAGGQADLIALLLPQFSPWSCQLQSAAVRLELDLGPLTFRRVPRAAMHRRPTSRPRPAGRPTDAGRRSPRR